MSGVVMGSRDVAKARLSRIEARLVDLQGLLPPGSPAAPLVREIAVEAAALREEFEAPAHRAAEAEHLERARDDAAELAFENYDFPGDREDDDRWGRDGGDEWTRTTYLLAGMDEPTVAVTFRVIFAPGSAEILSVESSEPDRPVVKTSSPSMEM